MAYKKKGFGQFRLKSNWGEKKNEVIGWRIVDRLLL